MKRLIEVSPENLEEVGECPGCLEARFSVLYDGLCDYSFGIVGGSWTMHHCQNCGSAFLSPRIKADSIGLAYEGGYYTHSDDEANEPHPRRPLAFVKSGLRNHYLNKILGGNRKPNIPLGSFFVEKLFQKRRARIDYSIRNQERKHGSRILDFGCGSGQYLTEMKKDGWTTFGIEPDPVAAEFCRRRGLEVRECLEQFADNHVDSITMDHVIEHVHRPLHILRDCLRVLVPGGKIWIATPNIDSRGHERFGQDWRGLEPPRHLAIFSKKALNFLLEKAGFMEIGFLASHMALEWSYEWSNRIRSQRGESPFTDMDIGMWINEDRSFSQDHAEEFVAIGTKPVSASEGMHTTDPTDPLQYSPSSLGPIIQSSKIDANVKANESTRRIIWKRDSRKVPLGLINWFEHILWKRHS